MSNIGVIGGQMYWKNLNLKLFKEDEKKYHLLKAHIWLMMLNDMMNPVKWLKTNNSGTKVNFDSIKNQADYDKALIDLKVYIEKINEKYGTDLKLS